MSLGLAEALLFPELKACASKSERSKILAEAIHRAEETSKWWASRLIITVAVCVILSVVYAAIVPSTYYSQNRLWPAIGIYACVLFVMWYSIESFQLLVHRQATRTHVATLLNERDAKCQE